MNVTVDDADDDQNRRVIDIAEGYDNTNQVCYKLRRVDDRYQIVAESGGDTWTVAEGNSITIDPITSHLEANDIPQDVIDDYAHWLQSEGIHRAMDSDSDWSLVMLGKNKVGFGYDVPFGDYGTLPTYERTRMRSECEYVAQVELE